MPGGDQLEATGNRDRCFVLGMQVSDDPIDARRPQPGQGRGGSLTSEASTLAVRGDRPSQLGDTGLAICGHRRLDPADGGRVHSPAHNPVQPSLPPVRRTPPDPPPIPFAKLLQSRRTSTREPVQRQVVKQWRHLGGVLNPQRFEHESVRVQDRTRQLAPRGSSRRLTSSVPCSRLTSSGPSNRLTSSGAPVSSTHTPNPTR